MSLAAELIRLGARLFIKSRCSATIHARRQRLKDYERWVPHPPANTTVREQPLGAIPAVRIGHPESLSDRHILFLHGGGYFAGSAALYRHITWRFAAAAQSCLIAIDYRLAPEHPFPAALDDAITAWQALLEEGANPRYCAIVGDSAGGGLALALALKLRDANSPLPSSLVALSPWTDLALTSTSSRKVKDPMLNLRDLAPLASLYLAGTDPRNPYASPLYGAPRGLPPTLLQVGANEILLDDAVRMAERMVDAGCDVTLEIWPRMPHVWHAFAPILPEARRAIVHAGAFIRRYATDHDSTHYTS